MDAAFNTQLMNLIKELNRMYPTDSDIAFIRKTVFAIITTFPEKPRSLFREYIKPFEKYVLSHDEDFFLRKTANELLENTQLKTDWSSVLIDKLKVMWSGMDSDTHEAIWMYLNVLLKLTQR